MASDFLQNDLLKSAKDNFLAFWFRFVSPMRSFIESDHPEIAMAKLKTGFIPHHVGSVYEDICRQKMWELNVQGKLPFLFDRVGRWWGGKDTEIDIEKIMHKTRNLFRARTAQKGAVAN